jgi:hypothetical protein
VVAGVQCRLGGDVALVQRSRNGNGNVNVVRSCAAAVRVGARLGSRASEPHDGMLGGVVPVELPFKLWQGSLSGVFKHVLHLLYAQHFSDEKRMYSGDLQWLRCVEMWVRSFQTLEVYEAGRGRCLADAHGVVEGVEDTSKTQPWLEWVSFSNLLSNTLAGMCVYDGRMMRVDVRAASAGMVSTRRAYLQYEMLRLGDMCYRDSDLGQQRLVGVMSLLTALSPHTFVGPVLVGVEEWIGCLWSCGRSATKHTRRWPRRWSPVPKTLQRFWMFCVD